MNKRSLIILTGIALVFCLSYGCSKPGGQEAKPPENTFAITGSVHELTLYPDPPPAFPEHEGKAEFTSYCGICHSLKYITMQPDFSAKTWNAEVTKMITKYHAPIDSVNAKKITGYLIAIKGKK